MKLYNYLIPTIIVLTTILSALCFADSEALSPKKVDWLFNGIFGKLDTQGVQRGFKVYKEVCSTCHGLKHVAYRNLVDIGFSIAEVKDIAKEHNFQDGPNEQGEMFERSGTLSDKFYNPFPNEKAARAANGGAYPVDLSLIIKARPNGANYVYSLLLGYMDPPENFKLEQGLYYNPYFADHQIAMPPPLVDNQVSYSDNTNATIEQMARDVVLFLQWTAEPEMVHRKSIGLKVMIFLIVFAAVLYIAKERIWSRLNN